jgi:transcriptional regulator with XRE-family HTH domain
MENMTNAQFTLSDLRKRAGLTQSETARRMGVTRPRVDQIERDFPQVRFNVMQAYFTAIGVNLYALGGSTEKDPVSVDIRTDRIVPDPRGPRDHGYRKRDATGSEPRAVKTGG